MKCTIHKLLICFCASLLMSFPPLWFLFGVPAFSLVSLSRYVPMLKSLNQSIKTWRKQDIANFELGPSCQPTTREDHQATLGIIQIYINIIIFPQYLSILQNSWFIPHWRWTINNRKIPSYTCVRVSMMV